jgi:quercetin dioxygenase-like cupin family protein
MIPSAALTLGVLAITVAGAQTPVVVDNEYVRILKVVSKSDARSAPHVHPWNRVMVYLDQGAIDIGYTESGKVDHQRWKPGDVAWSPVEPRHTSHNIGGTSIRVVEVELKKPAPVVPPVRDPKLDPIVTDPTHNNLLFENDQVRVFRSWREAGASETMHEHTGRGRIVVLLTDIAAKVKLVDGSVSEMKMPAGEVRWSPGPTTHAGTNTGASRFDMILIELK